MPDSAPKKTDSSEAEKREGDTKSPHRPFTVDTHLFQELGRLLVGRESTALSELIKNAYDADATFVRVHGEKLDDPLHGSISVGDDGIGITSEEFVDGFLRIASRLRHTPTRKSKLHGRRYTGAKGIGRLAAHKLAAALRILSRPNNRDEIAAGIEATIDWDEIEKFELLEQATSAVSLQEGTGPSDDLETQLILSRLRKAWSPAKKEKFVFEASSLQPPDTLTHKLPTDVCGAKMLFETPHVRDAKKTDPGFRLELTGDFNLGEDYWTLLAGEAAWVVEVRASREHGLQVAVAPTVSTLISLPDAGVFRTSRDLYAHSPLFDARFLVRDDRVATRGLRAFARSNAGIRVYMEGFRVLPYGDLRDDWLDIQATYTGRTSGAFILARDLGITADDERLEQITVPLANYHGAVFLTEAGSHGMEMLVNREGFVDGPEFEALATSLKWAVEVFVRCKAAATYEQRAAEREARKRKRETAGTRSDRVHPKAAFASDAAARELAEAATEAVRQAKHTIAEAGPAAAAAALTQFQSEISGYVAHYREAVRDDLTLLRLLASVGTQMASFIHEIRGLLGIVTTLEHGLERLRQQVDTKNVRLVRDLQRALSDLRLNLDRQVSYLVDVASVDARRRRSKQSVADAFGKALAMLEPQALARGIRVESKISDDIRTIPMFSAELRTVMTNLLSNAIKAAGKNGRIRAAATAKDGFVTFTLQNTGKSVSLQKAEQWFRPFQSSSVNVDSALGQGMGLGLPITRATLEPYNADISFIKPHASFNTAVRVRIPSA